MANPTIGATTPRIQYTATASQTVFTVPFEFLANADLAVYVNGTLKTLTTDYTLTGANTTGGGSLTFVTGRTAGDIVTILGNLAYSRDTNKYTKYGLLPAEVLEADFDAMQVQAKQLARDGQFALRAPLTDTGSPSMTLPVVATRASKALGFDASGNPVVSTSSLADIDSTVQIIDTLNALPAGSSASVSYQPAGTGAVVTTVQNKLRETVSVKDFGAVGNGTADDTAAIQAAINYCFGSAASPNGYANSKLNKVLFIPAGIYKLTDELVITKLAGGVIFGEGRFATTLQQTTANKPVIRTNGCGYSSFSDMQLDNASVANNTAVFELSWDGTSGGAALQSNTFRNMYFRGTSALTVSSGLQIGVGGYMGSENLIENCFFQNCVYGVRTSNFNALQNIILGGNFQGCTYGIYVGAGSISNIIGVGFQNDLGSTPQVLSSGSDIYFANSANDTCTIDACRSESMVFLLASNFYTAHLTACTIIPNRVTEWTANSAKVLDNFVNGGGAAYRCTTAGTTSGAAPTWGAATVNDGTVTWTRYDYVIISSREGIVEDCILPYGQVLADRSTTLLVRNSFTRADYLSPNNTPYSNDTNGGAILIANTVRSPTYQTGTITAQDQKPAAYADAWAPNYIALDAGRAAIMFRAFLGGPVGFTRGRVSPNYAGETWLQNSVAVEGALSPRMVSGTDQAGKDLYIAAGPGTGSGTGGGIKFRVAPAGSSGSTINDWVDGATLSVSKTFSAVNGLVMRTATAASIAAAANAVNGTGKVVGLCVWDTTNNRMMVASGSTTVSAWYVADGSASVTPA